MALTKLTTDLIEGNLGGGTTWVSDPKTASFTAVAGEGYFVNTTSAAITVTLPSSPSAGDEVSLVDYGANASTNNITITSSDNIEGAADDLTLSTDKVSKTLVYSDATKGWLLTAEIAGIVPAPPVQVAVDYLIVAGGGGGGGARAGNATVYAGGGGGGGYKSGQAFAYVSTDYTISVGPGGAGGVGQGTVSAFNGTNSSFIDIIATGGGAGGSSGGDSGDSPQNTGGANYTAGAYWGAGGGAGAGANGGNGSSGSGGNGGVGIQNAITVASGSGLYYAGGGGGGIYQQSDSSGGLGGGGNGRGQVNDGNPGTVNTGGGGGGAGSAGAAGGDNTGGTGGSGVVILRYPDTYTITETTSGGNVLSFTTNNSTVANTKITTFTAGENGTIQFS